MVRKELEGRRDWIEPGDMLAKGKGRGDGGRENERGESGTKHILKCRICNPSVGALNSFWNQAGQYLEM